MTDGLKRMLARSRETRWTEIIHNEFYFRRAFTDKRTDPADCTLLLVKLLDLSKTGYKIQDDLMRYMQMLEGPYGYSIYKMLEAQHA